jgi:protoporphyrinogen/coproporphyrinogen III oxidase
VRPRIAIVGAGIGGLAAAHHLTRLSLERGLPLEIVLLEASPRAGGVIGTERCEDALLERGPDTLVTHKPAGLALCRQLGLGDRIAGPPPGQADILQGDRLVPIPAGFALLAPTRRWPLLATPLLSWRGKLRALAEPRVPPAGAPADGDESVAAFVRRRFGAELLERIAEPIVGAIALADVDHLSLAATLPRFLALEREHGNVTGARARPARRAVAGPSHAPAPVVVGLAGGLGQIVDALVARLPPGSLRLATRVERLLRHADGFELRLANGESLSANAVLLAAPGHAASPLLGDLDPAFAAQMREIEYASCVTVNLAWPRTAAARPPSSHGFFVPRRAGLELVAAGFVNVKFPERAPADQIVVRVFLGGAARPETDGRADDELVEVAVRALTPVLGLRRPPTWFRVFRHPQAMPQLAVGHLALVARLRARLAAHPGLELAGGPVGAHGLPDSIAAGESAAERLLAWLARHDAPARAADPAACGER